MNESRMNHMSDMTCMYDQMRLDVDRFLSMQESRTMNTGHNLTQTNLEIVVS